MLITVVGGNLQGVEAAYLARKAGWQIRVIDKDCRAPAFGLCDEFIVMDATEKVRLREVLQDADLVLPALESSRALECLCEWAEDSDGPLIFDSSAYSISASKLESDRLFERMQLPVPLPWPTGRFPIAAKPSSGSGSKGVRIFSDMSALQSVFGDSLPPPDWVLQEYLAGPSFSLEVMGINGKYRPLQVTDLEMDADYDCKRVSAPSRLSQGDIKIFEQLAVRLARELNLKGIMDVEVIRHKNILKLLEIDARFPSQTPTAVFWSSGLNMILVLGELFCGRSKQPRIDNGQTRGVMLEHIRRSGERLEVGGEHLMTGRGPLHVTPGFFGSDEAITNFTGHRNDWVATLIHTGADRDAAWNKRNRTIARMMDRYGIRTFLDPVAAPVHGRGDR